ncbi:hypothetical protein LTR04_001427 [Oleoguttula sp. CCFEE 6159]|nr:hypothetical protein LTR04_001427 [Oleoguttula sp. CCFEE 6159]
MKQSASQWMTAMPPGDNNSNESTPIRPARAPPRRNDRSVFTTPTTIKRLFAQFPLITYPSNELPLRAPSTRQEHSLYVFVSAVGAARNAPSFNPACLKYQTYLKFSGIPFRIISSNNHASPTGALPFLLPAAASSVIEPPRKPVPANKLEKWAAENGSALHDSSNTFVTMTIAHQLRAAAEAELLKHSPSASKIIDAEALCQEAEEAFKALSTLLGEHEWFFGVEKPGMFDAGVFAYTHLLLDETLGWRENRLGVFVGSLENLVRHREGILREYFPGGA